MRTMARMLVAGVLWLCAVVMAVDRDQSKLDRAVVHPEPDTSGSVQESLFMTDDAAEGFGDRKCFEPSCVYEDFSVSDAQNPIEDDLDSWAEVLAAFETMQSEFFETWLGDWPAASDWTGAVMGTYVSAVLNSLTRSFVDDVRLPDADVTFEERMLLDNFVNKYFAQSTAYYFAEEAYSIRLQAYDDMLWVVLGWLESIKFINAYNDLYYSTNFDLRFPSSPLGTGPSWHGKQFEAAFAHRAHVFYDLVNRAWDERLCGGGLTWNPSLRPYKNTITNTLFMSAAVGMYLYHPGDDNRSPFLTANDMNATGGDRGLPRARPHDPRYLHSAIRAYDWLIAVNMTDSQGLFVDGYHINNTLRNNTQCDLRNEMVYTYNQGVLLSALRGLWESTGNLTYLNDGHALIDRVIAATGWRDHSSHSSNPSAPTDPIPNPSDSNTTPNTRPRPRAPWSGLGQAGILQELCDRSGTCSQDAQTFKGIFFHHLTLFCEPLPTRTPLLPGRTHVADPADADKHARKCAAYEPWVERNARAALGTRDGRGVFGMWWGAGTGRGRVVGMEEGAQSVGEDVETSSPALPRGAMDVRNDPSAAEVLSGTMRRDAYPAIVVVDEAPAMQLDERERDYNDRGRGRTVETQGGGLMVLRALHELRTRYGYGGA